MSERDDAIRIAIDALKYLREYIKGFDCDYVDECYPGDPDACNNCKAVYRAEVALAALDKRAVEPCEDAREFAKRYIRENSYSTQEYGYQVLRDDDGSELAEELTAHDERIRAEALREAADRVIEWYDQLDDPIQSQRDDIRAAIIGKRTSK